MKRAKRGSLALSSCLLAAFCLGLGAASAQAEGNYSIEGKKVFETVEVTAEKDTSPYSFLLPKLNMALVFEDVSFDKSSFLVKGESSYRILFTKGQLYTISPWKPIGGCTVSPLDFKAKGALFLHNSKTYERLTPAEGTTLTVAKYSEECPVGEENPVTGTLVLEDANQEFGTEAVSHLVQQAPAALFPELKMEFGSNEMTLDGSWRVKLAGKESGKKWSAVG